MARIRALHPRAPQDDDYASLPMSHRLLWSFLPCYADRQGRLEDRPLMLKGQVFPTDDVNVDEMLSAYVERGWIIRYQADGKKLIQIVSFHEYQKPDHHERESVIQPPEGWTGDKGGRFAQATPGQCPGKPTESGAKAPECQGNAAPDLRISGDLPTPRVCARSNPLANEPGKPSTDSVLSLFSAIRARTCATRALFYQPSEPAKAKCAALLAGMDREAVSDIEPAIQLACEHVRDGAEDWTDNRNKDPNFLWGTIASRWTALREELHGCAPKAAKPKGKSAHEEPRTWKILER